MLKIKATDDLVLFGLSEMNLVKLREGKPIEIDMSELGMSGRVIIFYGGTEGDMRRELADLIGPRTVYTDKTRKDG